MQFLEFVSESNSESIDVLFEKGNIWSTVEMIAKLYNIDRSGITRHINNILKDKELDEKVVCADFAHTTKHGVINDKTQTKMVTRVI